MTALYIILIIVCAIAVVLWFAVLISNEVQKDDPLDAFTPVWMVFLFIALPLVGIIFSVNKISQIDFPYWVVIPVTVLALIFSYLSGVKALKNFILKKNEELKAQKLKIDSEYKKRFELIPNLVKVIKSFTENENKTIEKVLETRQELSKNYSDKTRKSLDQSVNVLLHSTYDYPALQNMPLYRNLNASLVNTQENIAYYSTQYNKQASEFNAKLKSFPVNIFSKKMNIFLAEYVDEGITDEQKSAENLLKDL